MKNANKRDQFLPSTEGIFSVMKDECFKLPCLKPSTGFPFALKIKSKLLNMAYKTLPMIPSPYLISPVTPSL